MLPQSSRKQDRAPDGVYLEENDQNPATVSINYITRASFKNQNIARHACGCYSNKRGNKYS
jgi:sulfur relay (sulfurtransferase) complex TusBCD TusD component (DsrE family)